MRREIAQGLVLHVECHAGKEQDVARKLPVLFGYYFEQCDMLQARCLRYKEITQTREARKKPLRRAICSWSRQAPEMTGKIEIWRVAGGSFLRVARVHHKPERQDL